MTEEPQNPPPAPADENEAPAPAAPAPQPQAEPAHPSGMQLHVPRPGVTRLSRRVLAGLCSVVAAGVFVALAIALWPHRAEAPVQAINTGPNTAPEALASVPKDYAEEAKQAPQLGPPLPGDLGKPMLRAGITAPGMPAPQTPEQQHIAQERDAARTSKLFISAGLQESHPAMASTLPASPVASAANPQSASDPTDLENMQDRKIAFMNETGGRGGVSPARIEKPASPYVIQAGWIIAGALDQGLKSDLPGNINALVTENVYDSPTGHYLLIPQGSRLFGRYSSQVSFGQTRVQVIWTRLIFPNGNSIALQNLPGTDAQGYAGLEDGVDEHWGSLFKAALLSTVLSVGAEAGTSNSENNLAQAIRQGASQSINQTGQQIVERNLNIQPTLTARFGLPVRIIVDRDLVLAPYPQQEAKQ